MQSIPLPRRDAEAATDPPGPAAALVFRHKVFAVLQREGLLSEERTRLLLSWRHSGFFVHTSVTVSPDDRDGLERLARYLLRPPASLTPRRRQWTPRTSLLGW
jgi:hypothetical protein